MSLDITDITSTVSDNNYEISAMHFHDYTTRESSIHDLSFRVTPLP